MLLPMTPAPSLQPDLTVALLLAYWPETAGVFFKYQTACVGCRLGRFCTLADVVESYSLSMEALTDDVQRCIKAKNQPRSLV